MTAVEKVSKRMGNKKRSFQVDSPVISPVIRPSIYPKKYKKNKPNIMKMFGQEPVIVAISIGAFYRITIGITALNSPAQNPWKNLTTKNNLKSGMILSKHKIEATKLNKKMICLYR